MEDGTTQSEREVRLDDMKSLVHAAIDALVSALHDGAKHPAGTWRAASYAEHINHMQKHIFSLLNQGPTNGEGHRHFTHLICRAVMAYAVAQTQRPTKLERNDNG